MTSKQYTAGYRELIAAVQRGPLSADMRRLGQQLLQSNLPGGKKKDIQHALALPDFKDDGDMIEPSADALNRFKTRSESLLERIDEAVMSDKERAAAQKKSASDIKQALRQKGSNTVAFHGREEEPKKPAANLMARQKWGMDKILYRVNSDNFKGLMTPAAYKEATLQMSSGDFGSHTKVEVPKSYVRPREIVWDYDPEAEPEDAFKMVQVRDL